MHALAQNPRPTETRVTSRQIQVQDCADDWLGTPTWSDDDDDDDDDEDDDNNEDDDDADN